MSIKIWTQIEKSARPILNLEVVYLLTTAQRELGIALDTLKVVIRLNCEGVPEKKHNSQLPFEKPDQPEEISLC